MHALLWIGLLMWSAMGTQADTVPNPSQKADIASPREIVLSMRDESGNPIRYTTYPNAVPVAGAVMQGNLAKHTALHYPKDAKRERIHGMVVLHVRIDKEGHLHDIEAIAGPDKLRQAAVECAQQWEYRPYLLNGVPVDVDTTINLMFLLSD